MSLLDGVILLTLLSFHEEEILFKSVILVQEPVNVVYRHPEGMGKLYGCEVCLLLLCPAADFVVASIPVGTSLTTVCALQADFLMVSLATNPEPEVGSTVVAVGLASGQTVLSEMCLPVPLSVLSGYTGLSMPATGS